MRSIVSAVALGLVACAPRPPANEALIHIGDAGINDMDYADAEPGPGAPDARVQPAPLPDAAPPPVAEDYPPGPYGTRTGKVMKDLSWTGFPHGRSDSTARTVYLHELYAGSDPEAKIIQLTQSAGWCGTCWVEAEAMASIAKDYEPRGVRFMTVLIEDEDGNPGNVDFAKTWAEENAVDYAVVADDDYNLDPYDDDGSLPFNIFLDAKTMTILEKVNGFDPYEETDILDYYLESL